MPKDYLLTRTEKLEKEVLRIRDDLNKLSEKMDKEKNAKKSI